MWQQMRSALVGLVTVAVLVGPGPGVAAASSDANRLVRVSGTSPFTDCPAAGLDALLPTGEVEPVVVANPTDRANVVAAWTQDRFRGVVAGVSLDRGRTWRLVVVPGLTGCTGGVFDYADDVAMSAGSDGVVHLSAHVFDVDRQRSGLLATRSTDGGRTWGRPVALAVRTGSRGGEYAGGTIAADPADPRLVYGVVPTFSYPSEAGGSFRGTVVVARSLDGGSRWQPARSVLDSGRVHVAWQDARFSHGQADAIALAFSPDDGTTWTTPAKVNATPTNIPVGNQQAFAPNLAVATDGTVGVSYFDVRHNDGSASLPTDRWLVRCRPTANPACTRRPARPETRLTAASFDMRQAHLLTSIGPPGFFLGDYMGLTSTGRDFLAVFAQPHNNDPASVSAATRPSQRRP